MKNKNKRRTKMMNFQARVKLGKSVYETISFEIEARDELSLAWDDVYDAAVEEAEKRFSIEDFPNMDIEEMFIIMKDGTFPVVAEDENIDRLKPIYKKILILPYATYSLTPEYKTFLTLSERGLIKDKFDFDAIHKMLSIARDKKN